MQEGYTVVDIARTLNPDAVEHLTNYHMTKPVNMLASGKQLMRLSFISRQVATLSKNRQADVTSVNLKNLLTMLEKVGYKIEATGTQLYSQLSNHGSSSTTQQEIRIQLGTVSGVGD